MAYKRNFDKFLDTVIEVATSNPPQTEANYTITSLEEAPTSGEAAIIKVKKDTKKN